MTTPVDLMFRDAMAADVPAVVTLLADDRLGKKRERAADPLPQPYWDAFAAITADPRSKLIVVEKDRKIVGTMQLSFIPSLSHQGAERLVIESVRVGAGARGQGIGSAMMHWAIDAAKARGVKLITLTSHRSRRRAHAFYQGLGFERTHLGFRYEIPS